MNGINTPVVEKPHVELQSDSDFPILNKKEEASNSSLFLSGLPSSSSLNSSGWNAYDSFNNSLWSNSPEVKNGKKKDVQVSSNEKDGKINKVAENRTLIVNLPDRKSVV